MIDYVAIYKQRAERLEKIRADRTLFARVSYYYKFHPADFINDWGITYDPRLVSTGRSPVMPFLLWRRQRELIDWMFARWMNSEPGTIVKSRDVGVSWLSMCFLSTLSIFWENLTCGVGSEKEDKIDRSGDPDTLFYKLRMFLGYLPIEWRGGWSLRKDCSAHMRIYFPNTKSSITGETGDNIGRGGRKAIYLVDESAHIPNPKALDAALAATTDCRLDASSVKGMANSFAERAHNPNIQRFDFDFKDDPRKDDVWEQKKRAEMDPVLFAAEYERNFSASVEGIVIPSDWVLACIDAHVKLGIAPTGAKRGALDIADTGRDANALAVGDTFLLSHIESWKGRPDLDIYHSIEHVFLQSDLLGFDSFSYDADGLGAGARGDARKINEARRAARVPTRQVEPFRGSGSVFEPDCIVEGTERTALDFFENLKAQGWWFLRRRFQYTFRLLEQLRVTGIVPTGIDASRLISISSTLKERARLCSELSQPVWMLSKNGKMMVDKCPPGTKREARDAIMSPNLADSVMMLYAPRHVAMSIHPSLLASTGARNVSRTR